MTRSSVLRRRVLSLAAGLAISLGGVAASAVDAHAGPPPTHPRSTVDNPAPVDHPGVIVTARGVARW